MPVNQKPIKIIMVDDSPVVLHIYRKLLAAFPGIEVLATFTSATDALEAIPVLQPDVITTDFHMPKMNGLEFINELMDRFPKPVLVISSSVQQTGDEETIFALLEAGAVDVFPKPMIQVEDEFRKTGIALAKKLSIISGVLTIRRRKKNHYAVNHSFELLNGIPSSLAGYKMVSIGASTGGPQVLTSIFQNIRGDFPLPVVCVQHISEGFIAGLVEWLDNNSPLQVKFAVDGEFPENGTVYFPPEDNHLKFAQNGKFLLEQTPPKNGHRPSVDETFHSAAAVFGSKNIAVLLTGMGSDGAEGMKAIRGRGGFTIAQDEQSCTVYGMPRVAVETGGADISLDPRGIIEFLNNLKT